MLILFKVRENNTQINVNITHKIKIIETLILNIEILINILK